MPVKREVIVGDDGEVLYERTKTLRMYLFTERGYVWMNNRKQIKRFPAVPWPKTLTAADTGRFFFLAHCLNEHNRISEGDSPMSVAQMGKVAGLSKNRMFSFLRQLIDLGLIARTEQGHFVNPLYFFSGKHLSPDLYGLFREQIDAYLPAWVVKRYREMDKGGAEHGSHDIAGGGGTVHHGAADGMPGGD